MPIDGDVILKAALDATNVEKSIEGIKGTIKKGFRTFLRYGLGVRSFFFLFRKLRKQLIDGFGNLAQVSQPFNTAMSSMQNALAGLKSSFASAFAPIIQAVAPAITTFINLIADAVDSVGKLIAALTGQTTYIKYIATQQDYAQSVNDTAKSANKASKATDKANKSAKKYQKTLAGFDDINILKEPDNDTNSGTSGSGSGTGGKLSPVAGVINTPLSEVFTNLSDKLKQAWEKVDFTEIGTIVGTKLKGALDNIPWNGIKDALGKIATSAATFLNGFFETPGLFASIGTTIAQAFSSILLTVYAFVKTLHWKSIGKAVVNGIVSFFKNFDWNLAGATLYELLNGLLDFLLGIVENIPWEDVPDIITTAISDFLEGFGWRELIDKTIGLIKEAIDGLIKMIAGDSREDEDSPLVKALQSLKDSVSKIDSQLFEDLGRAIEKVVSALKPVAKGFGAGFIEFISKLIDIGVGVISALSDALDRIGDALGGVDPEVLTNVGIALGTIVGAFTALHMVWGIVTAIGGIITGIGTAASAAVAPISAIGTTLLGIGGAAIAGTAGLTAFFTLLNSETMGVDESKEELNGLTTTFGQVQMAVRMLGNRYGLTIEQQDAMLESMRTVSETDGPAMQKAFGDIEQQLIDAGVPVGEFGSALESVIGMQGSKTEAALNNINTYLGNIGESAQTASADTTDLSGAFGLFSAPGFSAILKLALLKGAVDSLGSSGKLTEEDTAKLQKTLNDYDASPTEENMSKIQKAMEDAGVSAGDLNVAYIDAVDKLPKDLKAEYLKLASEISIQNARTKSKMEEGGENVVQGAIDGVESKKTDMSNTMTSLFNDWTVGPYDNAADIQSPSKVMMLRGQYLVDGLRNGIMSRKSALNALMTSLITDANKIINSFANAYKTSGSLLAQSLYVGLQSGERALINLVSDMADDAQDAFNDDGWYVVGHNAAVGIYNGFVSLNGRLQQLAYTVARNMLQAAENALGIASPSKEFAWVGEMTMRGLAGGIVDNEDKPIDSISDITNDMEKAAENADLGITFNTKLAELLNTFDLILTDFSDTIIEKFDNLIGSLAVLNTPAFADIPNVVSGRVVPYSINSATNGSSPIAELKSAISELNNNRLTREDITDIVNTALRNMPIDLYIGDEQIARHANTGNAKLSRRFN